VTKSHISSLNVPTQIDVIPIEITIQKNVEDQSISKIKIHKKKKEKNKAVDTVSEEVTDKIPEEIGSRIPEEIDEVPKETQVPNDYEMSIYYVHNGKI
jgi:hypothetical protein